MAEQLQLNNDGASIICSTSDIQGKVIFGKGCIVHPGCAIVAEAGEIIFGDFNIIEERSFIYNKLNKDKNGKFIKKTMKIGNYNIFEVGTFIESSDIGDFNIFQHRSQVESQSLVKNGCILGTGVRVSSKTVVENQSAIHFPGKIIGNTTFNEVQHKVNVLCMVGLLQKLLPAHNQLKKI